MPQQTTRPTKKLGELTPGDFVFHRRQNDSEPGIVCEAKAMLPYRDGDGHEMVSGLLVPVAGGAPLHVRQFANILYVTATEGDVREASEVARRISVANALRQVADDIAAQALPVPRYSFTVGGVVDSRGELELWAEHLGVEIRMSGDIPVVDKAVGGLTVHFQSNPEPAEPKPEPSDDEIAAEIDAAFAEPQTREIKARYLTAGMAVISGRVREPLTVMSVLRDPDDSDFVRVAFRFVSGETLYGVEDAVTVLADEQPATAEPQDGHVYSCCGKTGRISRHEPWCEVNKAAADAQPAGE